jgi:hypothetical protein
MVMNRSSSCAGGSAVGQLRPLLAEVVAGDRVLFPKWHSVAEIGGGAYRTADDVVG